MAAGKMTAHGVDALIERLRADGVSAGEAEAARLRADAAAEAEALVAAARREADAMKREARDAAERYRRAGEEALNTAMRDAVLSMKADLMARFEADVGRLVSSAMADPELLKQMILEIAGRARTDLTEDAAIEIVLPTEIAGPEEIRANPEEFQSGRLTRFVLGLAQEMLRSGVTLHASEAQGAGLRVVADAEGVTLDLSDAAIAEVLLRHMQPRFRAVLDGVIR